MSINTQRQGGTGGYKAGNLQRKLEWVTVFSLGNWPLPTYTPLVNETTSRLRLRGLNPNLSVLISCGITFEASNAIPAYPALPGTLQVTPYQVGASGEILYLKDLTIAPATLPASYTMGPGLLLASTADNPNYGAQLADGAIIRVTADPAQYADFGMLEAKIVVAVEATFNGNWWDPAAIEYLLGQLVLEGTQTQLIQLGGF